MKTIGLIGGMSWESTALYYQHINREVARRLGGLRSAPLNLISLDFEHVATMQRQGQWSGLSTLLQKAAQDLEHNGAEAVLICTNTMHRMADEVQACIQVPLLHIADAVARSSTLRYRLRLLRAKPSSSRTVGTPTMRTPMLRSSTMRRISTSCW